MEFRRKDDEMVKNRSDNWVDRRSRQRSKQYGWDKEATLTALGNWSEQLGVWAIPVFVSFQPLLSPSVCPASFSANLIGSSLFFLVGQIFTKHVNGCLLMLNDSIHIRRSNGFFMHLRVGIKVLSTLCLVKQTRNKEDIAGATEVLIGDLKKCEYAE